MRLKKFERNSHGKDYVVGDLHGYYDDLMGLLDARNFDREVDRLFCVGDLIDRGPNSAKCIRLLEEPWFHSARGNHEEFMLNNIPGWHYNGGCWAMGYNEDELEELASILRQKTSYALEIDHACGKIGIVHSEPGLDWNGIEKFPIEHMVWSRERFSGHLTGACANIDLVFAGHSVVRNITYYDNVVNLETGSFLRTEGYTGIQVNTIDYYSEQFLKYQD